MEISGPLPQVYLLVSMVLLSVRWVPVAIVEELKVHLVLLDLKDLLDRLVQILVFLVLLVHQVIPVHKVFRDLKDRQGQHQQYLALKVR
jgi:hypothetical protein